ncbi:hypothetical protein TWF506_005823 [Arthrobotrys conoides]|uniref:Uncharacterized protein n=1 Tax=Arthrobotrys conoides TaxID=74498 RepID=A0AAN8NPY6_9PEZI
MVVLNTWTSALLLSLCPLERHWFISLEDNIPCDTASISRNIPNNKLVYIKPLNETNLETLGLFKSDIPTDIDFSQIYSMIIIPTPPGSSSANKSVDTPPSVPLFGLLAVSMYLMDLFMM